MFLLNEFRQAGLRWIALAVCALATVAGGNPDQQLEEYLTRLGLREALAVQLSDRLDAAPAEERIAIAERLGRLYAQWLQEARTPEERQRVESLASQLLGRVPEAETIDLRISLARVGYLEGARLAERYRLRLARDEEVAEADRLLRQARGIFGDVASQAHRRVDLLERREKAGRDDSETRMELAEARRQRSVALYHSGWAGYYLALLTGNQNLALDALRDLAWILNSGAGKLPDASRVPEQLLEYEHVADAALCASLCHALRGSDAEAASWILLIERSSVVPQSIRDRLMLTKIAAYGATKRWGDLEWAVRQRSRSSRDGNAVLSTSEARLLAVQALEAASQRGTSERDELLNLLAQVAFAELIRQGEIGQVIDLVDRYGTTPIGSRGFIIRYVQGLRAYDRARELHAGTDETSDPAAIAAYGEAAQLLLDAANASDAGEFPAELAACRVMIGLSRERVGQHREAAEQFELAAELSPDEQRREEALWRAIGAMDRAIEDGRHEDLRDRRSELIAVFIQLFPASERTAGLVLAASDDASTDPEEAIRILLDVSPSSGLYVASRSEAANRLYAAYRSASGEKRRELSVRTRELGLEVLQLERASFGEAPSTGQLERLVLRHRQLLDAALFAELPDPALARQVLASLEALAISRGFDLSPLAGELDFRRLQLALVEDDETTRDEVLLQLRGREDRFARLADLLVFRDAVQRWEQRREDSRLAREVVRHGVRVIGDRAEFDAQAAAIAQQVADAAERVWQREEDRSVLGLGLEMERRVAASGFRTPEGLRRLARLSEAAGDNAAALDAWRLLLAALVPLDQAWFEARYESLRLLSGIDRERAIQAMQQHVLLHPQIGPEPWGTKVRELAGTLGVRIAAPEPDSTTGDGT